MPVTVPDVVRALIAIAPEDSDTQYWLAALLPGLEVAQRLEARPATAPEPASAKATRRKVARAVETVAASPAAHPFATADELTEAVAMARTGTSGREIAEWFGLPLGPVAEWVAGQRIGFAAGHGDNLPPATSAVTRNPSSQPGATL